MSIFILSFFSDLCSAHLTAEYLLRFPAALIKIKTDLCAHSRQFYCQTPDLDQDLGLGVDFVLPLEQEQEEEQEQPPPKSTSWMLTAGLKFGPKA